MPWNRRVLPALLAAFAVAAPGENWPQWRGPGLNGISGEKDLPLHWTQTENIAWKLPLPGVGGATPIVWNDRIFLNVAEGEDLYLWAVNRTTGALDWKRQLGHGNYRSRKGDASSPSPVTDGSTVWVITGMGNLKAFDFAGKELWAREIQKDYGRFGLNWGYASSPLLYRDSLYIQVLHGMRTKDPSYLLRIDKANGKTLWRVERPTEAIRESPDSYTTPALLKYGTQTELVVTGGDVITGHDLETGKELWRGKGFNPGNDPAHRIIASPVVADGIVYAPTRVRPLIAFRAGGRGDITESHKLFTFNDGPDVPSPVTDGKFFYSINDRGIAFCLDAKTGKEIWGRQRLPHGDYSASPVLADGKIYITNEEGLTSVLLAGERFEILAQNSLDEYTLGSPAISDGQIFIRTSKNLYCIGKRK